MTRQQRNLFDRQPAPWELDDEKARPVATVVLPTGPSGEFDYLVPDVLVENLSVGHRVQVPFGRGNRLVVGYCVGLGRRTDNSRRLKEVRHVVHRDCLLSASMLQLTRWMADYYLADWGQVLDAVVPAGVRGGAGTRNVTLFSVPTHVAARITQLKLPAKQAHVLRTLAHSNQPLSGPQLAHKASCTIAPVTSLKKKGLITSETVRVQNTHSAEQPVTREQPLKLNTDQQQALDAILESLHSAEHRTTLVHGVTGSGKTEVYIQAIEEVVGFGRQAIVLVPEISLTPQTRQRFRERFDRVAVLHSHMTDSERHFHWQQIARGEVQVVVGARSAIFAPTPHLGLIILDEEHESTFKQETVPRYHARDVARQRALIENIPLVLGTATPSLESWQHTVDGTYQLVEMPQRVFNRPMPDVATIDLRDPARRRHSRGAISRPLHKAMDTALSDGGQVILLLNRRGFSTHIQCPSCGLVMECPHCDLALTHHRQADTATCHHCDYQTTAPVECPECQFTGIRYSGLGTQRLEAEVRARFPNHTSLRMDTDSMRRPGAHEQALEAFRQGEVQILLGTQMIAKGLDFPNVTLVGVINADTALHLADFRAAERTFQLITQVAGRTGRGEKGGHVLVQTFTPDHPAIQAAVCHDYARFARYELPVRKALGYPPFASLVRLVVRGEQENSARGFADHLAERLRAAGDANGVRVAGPAPGVFPKLRGKYRFQIQAHGADGRQLHEAVRVATADLQPPDNVKWIVDVDPVDML